MLIEFRKLTSLTELANYDQLLHQIIMIIVQYRSVQNIYCYEY